MINEELAQVFEKMARVIAFKGGDRFRIMAYERAATSLRDLDEDLSSISEAGRLQEIPGIGKDLAEMIEEYLKTRRIRRYERERRGIADELIDLMNIPGLGPKTLAVLRSKLRIQCFDDLKRAIDENKLLKLTGFGAKKVENLKRGIDLWLAGRQRMPLGVALPLAENLLTDLRAIDLIERSDLAGSIRRARETIGDLDVLIMTGKSADALRRISQLPAVRRVNAVGETRASVLIEGGIQVDVRAVPKECYGATLQYFTGSKQHNIHLRTLARKAGLKINEYGIFRGRKRIGGAGEEEVYSSLGIPMTIPPELREDRGEIEAALQGKLPPLISLADLRGDLHAHTDYSDGKASAEEMVEHAAKLGYEYIALADHSPAARIAHGLDRDRLEQKIAEVERLRRKRRGQPPLILLGAEVDILPDGSLDYPDEVLAKLDVVTASVHAVFRQSKDRMTRRLLDAMANPLVQILGHPTGRLLGSREPVELDLERVIEKAASAGVALEVNASMYRLDLSDVMARAVQNGGALLAINSDAHSTAQLEHIKYGVMQARRGWIESRTVVNTWPWNKLNRWLQERRRGRAASAA